MRIKERTTVLDRMELERLYHKVTEIPVLKDDIVFVVGNSGSLNEMDLSRLSGRFLVGANRILRKMPVSCLVIADGNVYRQEFTRLQDTGCYVVVSDSMLHGLVKEASTLVPRADRTFFFKIDIEARYCELKSDMFGRSRNTGCYAVETAYRFLGGRKGTTIALLGMELRWRNLEQSHFFGGGEVHTLKCRPHFAPGVEAMKAISKILKTQGIKLVNLSPWDGPLDAFVPREAFSYFI